MAVDASFLDELSRFHLIVSKRVTSNYTGPRRSLAAGRGLTFKDYRIYSPGDDIRLIDWKVYARTDDLYVKSYEEERNLTVHVIIDRSASMAFGKPRSKFDYASMLGLGFAYLAMRENEKVQFASFGDDLEVFSPKRGASHLLSMVDHLNAVRPKGMSRLRDTLMDYRKLLGTRSLVVLISDFLLSIEEIRDSLYLLGDNEVKVIQVLDKVEKDLKMEGDYRLVDSESKGMLRTFISPRLRSKYQDQLSQHCNQIEQTCNKLNYDYHLVTNDMSIFDAFYKVLED